MKNGEVDAGIDEGGKLPTILLLSTAVLIRDGLRAGLPTMLLIVGRSPFYQLLEFFREKCLSLSAERSYAQAVGRFIEWLSVRSEEFISTSERSFLLAAFAHDLRYGTYEEGQDVYGLCWKSTSDRNLKRLTAALIAFSDWLSQRYGAKMLNPIHNHASPADQIIFWRKWNTQKAAALLAHTKSRHRAVADAHLARTTSTIRNRNRVLFEPAAFPAEHLDNLLWRGFLNPNASNDSSPWEKWNLRDILITLLCAYGGCRASEPLHLWVDDVFIDPTDETVALVLIHEPSDGRVEVTDPFTGVRKTVSRADYLQRYCNGRKPLTQETGRRHAGWKGVLLTHPKQRAFRVFWVDRNAGRLFLKLWRLYISYIRPITPNNPWAFLTRDGFPIGVDAFDDSFRSAVRRIGLTPSKWLGTSKHGLRHRYGQWIEELGLGKKEGQIALHHTNVKSQEVYRHVDLQKIVTSLGSASIIHTPDFISEL